MLFEDFELAPEILDAVKARNYTTPTPIQKQAIPAIMKGDDLIGCAQTGTGKTAGFALPLLHKLRKGRSRTPRALVLVPTRELAVQVHESIRIYGRYLRLRTVVIIGGVGFRPQEEILRHGVDILIATPGRLLDHLRQGNVHFRALEFLVIDEAARMLDMGFIPDIRTILKKLPPERQTLMFSATMPKEIRRLACEILKDPNVIEVTPQGTPANGIRQVVYPVASDRKRDLLIHLIGSKKMNQVLVFTRTKRRADQLAHKLEREGIRVAALHSDKSQGARRQALSAFRRGSIQVLVATDIAARGLDVKGISHVVNYEFPETAEDYVHRIGRTARAEATGDAISLMSADERGKLQDIEQLIGQRIPRETVPGFECKDNVLKLSRWRSFRPRRAVTRGWRRPVLSR